MHRVALVAALMLSGCFSSSDLAVRPEGPPEPWQGDGTAWIAHTRGCGFCFEEMRDEWADTVVLFDNGDVLWFSFHPDDGLDDHAGGVGWAEAQAVLPALQETGSYHAGRDVTVHEVRVGRLPAEDRARILGAMEDAAEGLEPPPGPVDPGCEDCSVPHVALLAPEVLGGEVMREGAGGEGTGNVPAGLGWDRVQRQMEALHRWI